MTYHRANKQVSSLLLCIPKEPSLAQFQDVLKLFVIYLQYYNDINLKTSKDVQ